MFQYYDYYQSEKYGELNIMNTQDKNYLLFVPSRLTANPKAICYKVEGRETEYVGMQTNEAVTKYLIDELHERNGKLDKIIMLCTEGVQYEKLSVIEGRTTLEYYKDAIREFLAGDEKYSKEYSDTEALFEIIPYSASDYDVNEIKKPLYEVLKITEKKEKAIKEHLYVDFTGGPRSAALTLIFTCRMLQLNEVSVEKILYSNIISSGQKFAGKIEECTKVYNVFAGLEAKEALMHGDRSKIIEYAEKSGDEDMKKTLQKLDETSSRREMANQTNQLEDVIQESQEVIAAADKIANMGDSLVAELVSKGIENQIKDSRNIVENPKYKELVYIEENLKRKKYDKVVSFFRENIIDSLIEFQIIKGGWGKKLDKKVVVNELMGVYCYYELPESRKSVANNKDVKRTFLDAVRDYINLLHECQDQDPLDILEERNKRFYDLREHMDWTSKRGFSHNGRSRYISNERLFPYLETDAGAGMNAGKLIEKYQKMEQVYMGYGFPFACTYGNTWFFDGYEELYKKNMDRGAKSLQKYFQGTADGRMQKALACFPKERFTYETLISALQKEQYQKMLHVLFPFELNKKSICSDVMTDEKWEEFIYDFVRSFYNVKQVRNDMTHGGNLEGDDVERAVSTVERVLHQIKEMENGKSAAGKKDGRAKNRKDIGRRR